MKSALIFAFALLTALTSASPSMSHPCDITIVRPPVNAADVICNKGLQGQGFNVYR